MASGCGSSGHGSSAGGSKKPAIVKLQVGGFPIELLGFEGKLWVVDEENNEIPRVQPKPRRITGRVSVGRTPLRIVALGGELSTCAS
jgi:hypothetical protein